MRAHWLPTLLPILGLACKADPGPSAVDSGSTAAPRGDCNPVEDSHCMLPFPSDFYLTEDAQRPSGYAVSFGPTTLPENIDGVQIDPRYWNERDGFSTLQTLFAHLEGAQLDGVAGHATIDRSLEADSPTVILNAETGERVPHWVERETAAAESGRDLLLIRPVAPLAHDTRYVVGLRDLVTAAGAEVAAPEGFAALRDGSASSDPDLERQRDHYEDIVFPGLDAAGVDRAELQLAWSFRTVSKAGSLGRMLWMRDDALERVGTGGPDYQITEVEEGDCAGGADIGRTLEGTFQAPLYLTDWDPGSVLARDDEGWPHHNGEATVPYTIRVPCTLLDEPRPGRLVQYGHGLLGDQSEIKSGYLDRLAQDNGWVIFATDWTGMKTRDATAIALMIVQDPSDFAMVPERTMQGFVEAVVAARLMQGDIGQDAQLTVDGVSLIDPEGLWFYGNSQGGVLGGGYAALSTDIERAVLGVPGTPFTLLLARASGFQPFFQMLDTVYEDWADISLLIGTMQMIWDPGESAGYASFMNGEPLDADTPAKDVLLQAAIGDSSVPTLGAHIMARAYGASLVSPETRAVWGLEVAAPPFTGSALVEFDYGIDDPPTASPGPEETDPHNSPRTNSAGIAQIATFLETGSVTHTCDGVCDPL